MLNEHLLQESMLNEHLLQISYPTGGFKDLPIGLLRTLCNFAKVLTALEWSRSARVKEEFCLSSFSSRHNYCLQEFHYNYNLRITISGSASQCVVSSADTCQTQATQHSSTQLQDPGHTGPGFGADKFVLSPKV